MRRNPVQRERFVGRVEGLDCQAGSFYSPPEAPAGCSWALKADMILGTAGAPPRRTRGRWVGGRSRDCSPAAAGLNPRVIPYELWVCSLPLGVSDEEIGVGCWEE